MSNFREFDRETGFLLPPSLDEWLPEQHLDAARDTEGTGSGRYKGVLRVLDGLPFSKVHSAGDDMPRLGKIFRGYPSVRDPRQNPCDLRSGMNHICAA